MSAPTVLPAASPPSAPADGAQLHAIVDGSDDAPVTLVLAHGWTLAQAAWDDVADLLGPADRRRRAAAGPLRPARARPLHLGPVRRRRGRAQHRPARRRPRRRARPAGAHRPGRPRRPLDGRHDDHVPGRGPPRAVRRPRPRRGAGVDVGRRPRARRRDPRRAAAAEAGAGHGHRRHRRRAGARADAAAAAADRTRGTRRWSASCSTAPTRPTRWCVAGAEIMHASTVRAFAAFYPALGEHDKRAELKALTERAGRDPGRRQRQADAEAAQPAAGRGAARRRAARRRPRPGTC